MKRTAAPIPFAASMLGAYRHVFAFFHSADEEYRVMLPFIEHGFEYGDRVFHVVYPKRREEHRRRLESAGSDVVATQQCGQFKLFDCYDAYFQPGHFDQHRMIALMEEELKAGAKQGFRLSRLIPTWNGPSMVGRIGAVIVEVLRTHSIVIIGGIAEQNPFFVQP